MMIKQETQARIAVSLAVASVFVLGFIDWITGYKLNFFVFYFLPVSVGAWYIGYGAAVILSLLCAFVWFFADAMSGHLYESHFYAVWNTMIRLTSFLAIGWSVSKIRALIIHEREISEALRRSMSEIKVLEGFLPICSQCKKIRDEDGDWHQMEAYIGERTNTLFSHSYCPECAKKAMEEAGLIKHREESR